MEHELDAYRKQCADICAAVPKNPTNLKLVFDLETTGLNPAEDEILEAAIVTTDGDILFESRFKPACVTEWPKAQNVNGISPEMVADAPGIIDKIGEMAALLQNAETIIGYNASTSIFRFSSATVFDSDRMPWFPTPCLMALSCTESCARTMAHHQPISGRI